MDFDSPKDFRLKSIGMFKRTALLLLYGCSLYSRSPWLYSTLAELIMTPVIGHWKGGGPTPVSDQQKDRSA
ncbi:hypothetical protein TNCV_775651 [Trichonephila clavipes]|nr:hypothetical protein TNCV_775651 [Trichonephila clavipes]